MIPLFEFYNRNTKWFLWVPLLLLGGGFLLLDTLGQAAPHLADQYAFSDWSNGLKLAFAVFFGLTGIFAVIQSAFHLSPKYRHSHLYNILTASCIFAATQGVTLMVIGNQYGWFPKGSDPHMQTTVALIVADTAAKGAFLDFIESFGLALSEFRPANGAFFLDTVVFIYRTLWSAIAAAIVLVLVRAWRARRQLVSTLET